MDKGLNELLKWGIENSTTTSNNSDATPPTYRGLNADALAALMGGPSDAELMIQSIAAVQSPEVDLENKLIAFDNFEQLIESLDNANNIANLSLWTPLLNCLQHDEAEIRKMAAWCVGTAVQNNIKSQERMSSQGGIPMLTELACKDTEHKEVRRKAIYALSSGTRNYQPAMDALVEELQKRGKKADKIDAHDMDAVDRLINGLKQEAAQS